MIDGVRWTPGALSGRFVLMNERKKERKRGLSLDEGRFEVLGGREGYGEDRWEDMVLLVVDGGVEGDWSGWFLYGVFEEKWEIWVRGLNAGVQCHRPWRISPCGWSTGIRFVICLSVCMYRFL